MIARLEAWIEADPARRTNRDDDAWCAGYGEMVHSLLAGLRRRELSSLRLAAALDFTVGEAQLSAVRLARLVNGAVERERDDAEAAPARPAPYLDGAIAALRRIGAFPVAVMLLPPLPRVAR